MVNGTMATSSNNCQQPDKQDEKKEEKPYCGGEDDDLRIQRDTTIITIFQPYQL